MKHLTEQQRLQILTEALEQLRSAVNFNRKSEYDTAYIRLLDLKNDWERELEAEPTDKFWNDMAKLQDEINAENKASFTSNLYGLDKC